VNLDDVTSEQLLALYAQGLFPMAESANDPEVYLMDPERRGIITLDRLHVPRSLAKTMKRRPFAVTINKAFDDVIDACAAPAPGRGETWINPYIRKWYKDLHKRGAAHSVECWDRAGNLAGGLYGVSLGAAFFGESMFSQRNDAGRIALVYLVNRLKERGFRLLDCQYVNPHLTQFGCHWISREAYHSLLAGALAASDVSFVDSAAPVVLEP
jgi:leucyl/phenylalanyl-tRNA--protein transferase